jgi:hypothetical protein
MVTEATMGRTLEGDVLRLRCARCKGTFLHIVFSGDTDMVTLDLCSLTAAGKDEVVVGQLDPAEFSLGYERSLSAFNERISDLLRRDDLRVVRFLRAEQSPHPKGTSFRLSREKYIAPKMIYACPLCSSGEAQAIEKIDLRRFRETGGRITIVGSLEFKSSG